MRNNRPASRRTRKSGGLTAMRILLSVCIVIVAAILKMTSAPQAEWVQQAVSGGMSYREAIAQVGRVFSDDSDVLEVFSGGEKKQDEPQVPEENDGEDESADESEPIIHQDFYVNKVARQVEEELEKTQVIMRSYDMSAERAADDTPSEPFLIPPPSSCSYSVPKIGFEHTRPLNGSITSKFGYRDHPINDDAGFHTGVDIAARSGTAVRAFAAGTVLEAGSNRIYGNYVLLAHRENIRSFYGHNSRVVVRSGQSVKLGQKICEVGSTGLSTGPHLHFEVRKNNIRVNPLNYI